MNIEKAIEILGDVKQLRVPTGNLDELTACNLGIEAMKRLQVLRAPGHSGQYRLLPGETEQIFHPPVTAINRQQPPATKERLT